MTTPHDLAKKYGLPYEATMLSVPVDVASKPVTKGELVTIVGSLQRFVIASSTLTLVAATTPDKTTDAVEQLYKNLAELRSLVMRLVEMDDG